MAPEETCYLQKERPYSGRPFHDRPRSSGKKPLFPRQGFPRSVEAGFVPTCCERTQYVLSTSLRRVPLCWANLPYIPQAPQEDRMPRLGQVVASSLHNMNRET